MKDMKQLEQRVLDSALDFFAGADGTKEVHVARLTKLRFSTLALDRARKREAEQQKDGQAKQ